LDKLYYQDRHGTPLASIAFKPISTGLLRRARLETDKDVYYRNPKYPDVQCPAGVYDGFSIPKLATILTLGTFKPFMPVVHCTLPHDIVCKRKMLSDKDRRELFKDAYDDAVRQFYAGMFPDSRRDALVRGVVIGNKYLGAC